MNEIKIILKRTAALLMCGFIIMSLVTLQKPVMVARADGAGDVIQNVWMWVTSAGGSVAVVGATGPEVGAVLVLFILMGVRFQDPNAAREAAQECIGAYAQEGNDPQNAFTTTTTIANHLSVTISQAFIDFAKNFVKNIHNGGAVPLPVLHGSISSAVIAADPHPADDAYIVANCQTNFYLTMQANQIFTVTSNDVSVIANNFGVDNGVQWNFDGFNMVVALANSAKTAFNAEYVTKIITTASTIQYKLIDGLTGSTITSYMLTGLTFPYFISGYVRNYTAYPVSTSLGGTVTINNTDIGTYDLVNGDTAASQNTSISADKPITVTLPVDTPYSDTIGKTASDVLTGDITATNVATGDTTGDVTATPDWTQPGTKSIDWGPLSNLQLFDKFPFCLPWDVKNLVTNLVVAPQAPDFHFSIPMAALHLPDFTFEVNFSNYESVVVIIRWGLLLVITGGLIFGCYKLIKH